MAQQKAGSGTENQEKKKIAKGDAYVCEVCGLAVVVDEVCGCVDTCDIICCSRPMRKKRAKAKTVKK